MATEKPQPLNNNTGAPTTVISEESIQLLDTKLDIVEDIPAELEDFIFLSRLGILEEAKGLFEQNLRPYISFFPVLAEYADMLLEEGLYADLSQLLTSLDCTRYSEGERNLLGLIKALSEAEGKQVEARPRIETALDQAKDWHNKLQNSPHGFSGLKAHALELYLSIIVLADIYSKGLDIKYCQPPWFSTAYTNRWEGFLRWFELLNQEKRFWEAQKIFAILMPVLPPETVSNMFRECCDSYRHCPQTDASAIAELTAINAYSCWVLQKNHQWNDRGMSLQLLDEAITSSLKAPRLFRYLFGERATFRGRCFCEWLENLQMLLNQANVNGQAAEEGYNAVIDFPLTMEGGPTNYWQLFTSDVSLFFRNIWYIPFMFFPLYPWLSGPMDELYPTTANLNDITFHCTLFVVQFAFLISLPFLIYLPVSLYFLYIATVLGLNVLMCRHFNKGIPDDGLKSTQDEFSRGWRSHDDEYWIFLSGICVGRNWLQHNIDRLSRTFHRPIVGVHNTTYGVIFDLVQCLIQRAFLYTTSDARQYYMLVEKALYRRGTKKIVLILHSQGGIKGSMVLDYLLEKVPRDLLQSLEVYTFGCLANHFSNPYRRPAPSATTAEVLEQGDVASEDIHRRTIPHIEHYANVYDFASRWGVLSFTRAKRGDPFENRFMGRVFVNPRAGHQLNQHYLDSIFPLDRTMRFTPEPKEGDFMGMDAFVNTGHSWIKSEKKVLRGATQIDSAVITIGSGIHSGLKMWELSRLWQYRNGRVPADTSTIGKV